MGVPLADLPDESPLAEHTEWFDTRSSRWHLRRADTGDVIVSDPVPRVGRNGVPLVKGEFLHAKADALRALKEPIKLVYVLTEDVQGKGGAFIARP